MQCITRVNYQLWMRVFPVYNLMHTSLRLLLGLRPVVIVGEHPVRGVIRQTMLALEVGKLR